MKQVKVETENGKLVIRAEIEVTRPTAVILSEIQFAENLGAYPMLMQMPSTKNLMLIMKINTEMKSMKPDVLSARVSIIEDSLTIIESVNKLSNEIGSLYSRIANYEKDMEHAKEAPKTESSE